MSGEHDKNEIELLRNELKETNEKWNKTQTQMAELLERITAASSKTELSELKQELQALKTERETLTAQSEEIKRELADLKNKGNSQPSESENQEKKRRASDRAEKIGWL